MPEAAREERVLLFPDDRGAPRVSEPSPIVRAVTRRAVEVTAIQGLQGVVSRFFAVPYP